MIDNKIKTSQIENIGKICAVVVTYNRLDLLKECIVSLRNQSRKVDQILVVNNSSTDGTDSWLQEQNDIYTIRQDNLGCAAGFHTGLSKATELGYDWFWMMDDDLILDLKALEELLIAVNDHGYDNAYCCTPLSNKDRYTIFWPGLLEKSYKRSYYETNYNKLSKALTYEAKQFPFLGIFLKSNLVKKAGLPLKDLFIWCDDTEYSWRLKKENKCKLLFVKKSIGYHPSVEFKQTCFFGMTIKIVNAPLWKIYYGLRNDCYINRIHKNIISFYFLWLPKRIIKIIVLSIIFYKKKSARMFFFFSKATINGLMGNMKRIEFDAPL